MHKERITSKTTNRDKTLPRWSEVEMRTKTFLLDFACEQPLRLDVPITANVLHSDGFVGKKTIQNPAEVIKEKLWKILFERERIPSSLLVIISDNTRPNNSPRASLRALTDILEQAQNEGKLPLRTTILIAGGTHKLMSEQEFQEFFGEKLWTEFKEKARELNVVFDEERGLPVKQHEWKRDDRIESWKVQIDGREFTVDVNKEVLAHEAIVSLADIDLHPYMGASGSPYKMCVIGLGGKNNIYYTHSPQLLLDAATDPGKIHGNRFYALTKAFGEAIFARATNLVMPIVSTNLVCEHSDKGARVVDVLVGSGAEWEEGAEKVFQAYKGRISRGAHIIIGGVDNGKDQTLDQGARLIDYFLRVHDSKENPVLLGENKNRVAVLFTPCNKTEYMGGIATKSAFKHLDKLREIVEANIDEVRQTLVAITDAQKAEEKISKFKERILGEWENYIMNVYAGEYGLGEGGQRAIRVLYILRNFNQFIVGTQNKTVVDYIAKLSPKLNDALHAKAREAVEAAKMNFNLLGMLAVKLEAGREDECANEAVQLALKDFQWTSGKTEPSILIVPNMHIIPKITA